MIMGESIKNVWYSITIRLFVPDFLSASVLVGSHDSNNRGRGKAFHFESQQAALMGGIRNRRMKEMTCPLCGGYNPSLFSRDDVRDYYQCRTCNLVFVPPDQYLSLEDEKKRYDLHRNSPGDSGYLEYLNRLLSPMAERLKPGSNGLDFGCGPEPVLADLFRGAGHAMVSYDQFYRPDDSVFDDRYDFITASEVVEHLRHPAKEFERLLRCLRQGGILGIMTQWVVQPDAFSRWHYKNDRTHICFYSPETFSWLAQKWGTTTVFPERDVVLFLKKEQV
jgi:hypothetical protein